MGKEINHIIYEGQFKDDVTMVLVDLSTLMVISTSGIGWMVRDLATANL